MADLTPYQRDIVIRTALGENRGHGEDGMADVIQNIFNRANSGRFPSDPAKVALQPKQYSTWNKGEGGNNPQQFKPGTSIWNKAERALEAVLAGRPDPTGGALDYHASNISPYWASSKDRYGTITRNGHTFYPTHPVPPGEIPSVGTFLDTVRMPPTPKTQTGVGRYMRNNTSPLGDNTALPSALQRYATTQANKVTPAIRRPTLPAMGTPNVNALYAGIYPRQNLTSPGAVGASVRSTVQDPTLAAALARRVAPPSIPQSLIERGQPRIGQSIIDRGAARTPISRGNLTNPGAIDASVNGLKQNTALQSALNRSLSAPTPVPQSQIERTALPRAPSDLISQSMQRIASANPTKLPAIAPSGIGQPPSTRMVRSVPMPPVRQSIPQRQVGEEPGLSRTPVTQLPRVTISTPNTVPQRMAGQDVGNVPRQVPSAKPFVSEARYIEPRNVPAPSAPYQGPFVPSKGLERLPANTLPLVAPVQTAQRIAPIPAARPPTFTTQMQSVQIPNPAWSATPAAIPAGTPMSGGLSRDAVALRLKGQAAAEAMAKVPRFITVQQPVRVAVPPPAVRPVSTPLRITVTGATTIPAALPVARPITSVQTLRNQGLSPADAYAAANAQAAQQAAAAGKYAGGSNLLQRLAGSGSGGGPSSMNWN